MAEETIRVEDRHRRAALAFINEGRSDLAKEFAFWEADGAIRQAVKEKEQLSQVPPGETHQTIRECPACHDYHVGLAFKVIQPAPLAGGWTHTAKCPRTGHTLLFRAEAAVYAPAPAKPVFVDKI